MIEAFVSKGAVVQPNWGMSEIGPITINIEFDSMDKVQYVKQRSPDDYTIMGDTYYCDWKIVKQELYVKGPTSIYDEWFATGDNVALDMGRRMYYIGRK
jgi:long-subunit acyl-CoA synthetase (AMP-forming)